MHGNSRFRGGSSSEVIANVLVAECAMHAYATLYMIIMVFSSKIIIIACIVLHRHEHQNWPAILCRAYQVASRDNTTARGARAVWELWKHMYGGCVGGPEIMDERD